jgi:exopolysaccharide biosynthesis WecB/TagA/CpsF family protein
MRRVAGADLVPRIAAAAAEHGLHVFFLGSQDGAAQEAADRLTRQYPSLRVSVYEPPLRSLERMDDLEILRRLDDAHPHILFVAFGHPKQEKWISRNRDRLPMVAMGVGCSLDLIAGRHHRAPTWMQRLGLEWSYRVALEPRRLARRYLRDGVWLVGVVLPAVLLNRSRTSSKGARPT